MPIFDKNHHHKVSKTFYKAKKKKKKEDTELMIPSSQPSYNMQYVPN